MVTDPSPSFLIQDRVAPTANSMSPRVTGGKKKSNDDKNSDECRYKDSVLFHENALGNR